MNIKANRVKEKLAAGEHVFGCFIPLGSPELVEILGLTGFDFVLIDSEHGPLTAETGYRMILAAEARGIEPFVRVGERDQQVALKFLDVGATGIMTPRIASAEHAREAIAGTKFYTTGVRGLAGGRTFDYGLTSPLSDYVTPLNDRVLNMIQFEHVDLLQHMDELLKVEGLDVLFIGPSDLAQSLGLPGQPNHPDVTAVADDVIARCKEANVKVGTVAYSIPLAQMAIERGFDMIVAGAPAFFGTAAKAWLEGVQE